jgi:hypothetical protein
MFLLRSLLRTFEFHEKEIKSLDDRLIKLMADHSSIIEELYQVPGINEVTAGAILAEVDDCIDTFPTASHLIHEPVYTVEDRIPRVYPWMNEPFTLLPRAYDVANNVSARRCIHTGPRACPGESMRWK